MKISREKNKEREVREERKKRRRKERRKEETKSYDNISVISTHHYYIDIISYHIISYSR